MKIKDALRAISLYPINPLTIANIVDECGLDGDGNATAEVRTSSAFKRATAYVYRYLAEAPAVNEAGASFSFTDDERASFRGRANALLAEIGEDGAVGVACGYIGEDF